MANRFFSVCLYSYFCYFFLMDKKYRKKIAGGKVISYRASIGCEDLNSYVGVGKDISREVNNRRVKLGKNATDKRLVYEYLKDYSAGLTVCEFLVKINCLDANNKIRFRPRFSDLCTERLTEQKKTICSVCGQKETLYLVCEV